MGVVVLQRQEKTGNACALGSINPNIGHVRPPVASFVKTALALAADQLPDDLASASVGTTSQPSRQRADLSNELRCGRALHGFAISGHSAHVKLWGVACLTRRDCTVSAAALT